MRKPLAAVMALVLVLGSILPGVRLVSSQAASASAPPPPTLSTPTPPPVEFNPADQPFPTPPFPGSLPPEVEETRVRQTAQVVLDKYAQYYGPRYEMTVTEAAVEGGWAYAVAESEGISGESVTLLAHRETGGEWQALMPGSDGLYLQWVDAVPESLMPAGEKSQLRTQATEADTLWRPQATPAVPPAMTAMPPSREETGRQPVEPTPVPLPLESASSVTWSVKGDRSVIYAITNEGTRTKVVDVPFDEMLLPQFSVFITLSPDGQRITYVTADDLAMRNARLWLVDLGSNSRRLLATFPYDFWIAPLVWSPDGTRIAFTKVTTPSLTSSGIELWTINVQSGEQTMLISDPSFRPELFRIGPLPVVRWSLDGTNITYTDYAAGDGFMMEYEVSLASGVIRSSRYPLGAVEQSQLSILATLPCGVTQFSQNDPEWRNDVMQTCGQTIGAAGCAVTSVAMTFRYYAVETSPRTLNQCLGNSACPIYWGTAASSCSGGKTSYLGSPGFAWSTVESDLSAGRPVIVELNGGNGHYVVVVSGSGSSGSGYTINDPWDGQVKSLAAYTDNGWTPTGLRIYGGTPWCQGGTCSAPSLIEPSDGAVLSSNTVTFRWNAVSGCTFNGYTFRVCTSPDVDNLSNCFIDTGEGGTQRTETINGHDNQDLYWGVRAANAPSGANWAVRRFRIEPSAPPSCNPNADQMASYADINYGGNCVTLGVGDYPNPGYLGSLGNDNAESIRVGSNVQAILYEHDNYGGRSETFTGDDPNLGDNTIGGNVVSSVKVQWRAQPPAAPALQSPSNGATFNEGQGINLSWSATGNEYYGEIWGGPGGTLTFGWQSGTSRDIGSQWAGYTYSWHVKARNGAGESGWSSTWTFTVKPAAPSNLSAQTASCSQINLYWNDNSGNEEGYKIYRNGSYVGQVGMNATSYEDTGLSDNTSYSYYVKAFRGSIESNPSNTLNITTPPCPPPQPDLVPAQWGDWQYPIVPSSITGTTAVNILYAGYLTYIDWGVANSGNADCDGDAYGNLYIDDTLLASYNFGNILAGWSWAFFDWPAVVVNTPGWHTLKVVADIDDLIVESNETNNVWQRDFYWTPSAPYADDMESGTNDWTGTGLWHQVDENSPYSASHSWSHSWWYGQDASGDYDTGAANSGDLTSPPIYIPSIGHYLRFWYRYETETQGHSWDQRWVQISVDGGSFNNVLQLSDDPMNWWLQSPAIDLSGYADHTMQVRLHFDTLDGLYNDYRGWYIDDFDISTTPPPSCADSHEPNDAPAQATPIVYGQTLSADICPGGDYDFYQFTGAAGDKIVVDIDAKVNGSLLDSYVFLLDSDGTSVLAEHDDEILSEVQDSHLGYQLPHDSTYYIKVKAWNHPSVGGTNYFYTIHLLTDDASPTAEITSPDHDSWLDTYLQTVTTDVSDGESGIRNVTFYWHDADWENSDWVVLENDWDSRDGWTYELNTSGIPEQAQDCAVFIYAYDWAGNYAGYGSYHLGIDHTPPTIAASVSPMYGDAPFKDFHVWWFGSDNSSGVASCDIQYRDGPGGDWTDLLTATTDTYYRFVGQDGHTYYFRARACDVASNQSAYAGGDGDAQFTVNICDTAPDVYEADNAASSARWIATDGTSQTHNVHAEGDQDWVKFYAAAGVTYTLVTTNTGGHADTVLYLYGTDGSTLIDSNDDYPGMWPASRLDWQSSASGTYYAKVNHWDPWAYGCTTGYGLTILTNDETPPSGSVSINNGATYAPSTATTLALAGTDTGTGVWQVMASNNSSFAGVTWTDYATSLDWSLVAGDGTKTVYVKFRDRAGNVSGVYSDTIILDTTAPTGSILIQGGAAVVTQTQVVLALAASDAHGVTHMRLRNGTAAWGAWEPFATSRTWALPAQEGERVVWVQFRDPAGNVSPTYSDSIVYQFPHHTYLPLIARSK
jgi:hypothetical protein